MTDRTEIRREPRRRRAPVGHRTNDRGTLILDRVFKGIGRIKKASGTDDREVRRLLDSMLTGLARGGRLDVLRLIKRGGVSALEVYEKFRISGVQQLPEAGDLVPLAKSMRRWVEKGWKGKSAHTRGSRKYQVEAILREAPTDARVSDLPSILRALKESSETPVMFNRCRAAALAFLRDNQGRKQVWTECRDIEPFTESRNVMKALEPAVLHERLAKLPDPHREMAWSIAMTGMGPGEFWGTFTTGEHWVLIVGTKVVVKDAEEGGRRRRVPLVCPIVTPTRKPRAFAKALEKIGGKGFTPYVLRRTYSHLLELAGISRTRRRIYLGHGAKDTTDLYEEHELVEYLVSDGAKLRKLLGFDEWGALKLVAAG